MKRKPPLINVKPGETCSVYVNDRLVFRGTVQMREVIYSTQKHLIEVTAKHKSSTAIISTYDNNAR